jgi:hypothetical protein
MSAEDANRLFRHFLEAIDENYFTLAQGFNHMPVMNDLVKNIDRKRKKHKCTFHDLYRPNHSCTKTSRIGQH